MELLMGPWETLQARTMHAKLGMQRGTGPDPDVWGQAGVAQGPRVWSQYVGLEGGNTGS